MEAPVAPRKPLLREGLAMLMQQRADLL